MCLYCNPDGTGKPTLVEWKMTNGKTLHEFEVGN